jgi:hypothetical protein
MNLDKNRLYIKILVFDLTHNFLVDFLFETI